MVMEASEMHHHPESHSPSGGDAPNANSSTNVYLVGLEFVRQYYTVLNQGPLYLHRFYSDDSSFVHGASARDSKVAYGQQEIHKRIQSLNFHNCHAKIRQVDSHETLGNGVVIQVTGELSNNGQPMRRFMQTFVLAPQSPKRYYVRNDIFHYQDEVFCDEDVEGDIAGESGLDTEETDDNEHEPMSVVEINGGSDIMSREMSSSSTMTVVEVSAKMSPSPRSTMTTKSEDDIIPHHEGNVVDSVVTVSAAEGLVLKDNNIEMGSPPNSAAPPPSSIMADNEAATNNNAEAVNSVPVQKTFANLFKSTPMMMNKPTGPPPQRAQPPQQHHQQQGRGSNGPRAGSPGSSHFGNNDTTSPPQVSPQPGSASAAVKGLPPRNPRGHGGQQNFGRDSRDRDNNRPMNDNKDSKDRRERLTSRSSTTVNDDSGSNDGDRRRPVHTYPDANQLFVGNLPHFTTSQDMKEIFQQFGEVAEVKIQKPTPKSGGLKVPYFCFVVFEEASSAQAAVDRKSEIFMKMGGGGSRRLNVEQKRSNRSGRPDGEHDGPYNRMDSSSPAGNRSSEGGGGMRGSRTFRGSNRGGGPGGDRDNRGPHNGGNRGGGNNMNSGRGGNFASNRGGNNNKP